MYTSIFEKFMKSACYEKTTHRFQNNLALKNFCTKMYLPSNCIFHRLLEASLCVLRQLLFSFLVGS